MKIQATLLALLFAVSCQSAGFNEQPGFASPESAFDSVVQSVRTRNLERLRILLGPESDGLLASGDEMMDTEDRRRFLELYDEAHRIEDSGSGTAVLSIGKIDWPFPIPAVKSRGSWYLDTDEAFEELLDRRIGANELNTQNACMALVDAQLEFVARDWNGNGLHEYAQRLRSTEGARDGLYWETNQGETPSPLGELFAAASSSGANQDSYHGYRFRLLRAQGESAPGGAYSYMAGDIMIGGFAVIAYPAEYGTTGVMSFMISHDETLCEKDLGPESETIASRMITFEPDSSWSK